MRHLHALLAAAASFSLAGCGAGAGGFIANDETGDLGDSVGDAVASYQVLDLSTGAIEPRAAIDNLDNGEAWRTNKMVFRRIDSADGSVPRFYMAVFEVTQGQWQQVTGATPWADVSPSGIGGGTDDELPAYGLSRDAITSSLSGSVGSHLALPTSEQWQVACRAGKSGAFSWGNDPDESETALYARVAETRAGGNGPATVGSLEPNAFGLYDMHGNVWELTADSEIHGGSWYDTVMQARSTNRLAIDRTTAHALVGARLVLVP